MNAAEPQAFSFNDLTRDIEMLDIYRKKWGALRCSEFRRNSILDGLSKMHDLLNEARYKIGLDYEAGQEQARPVLEQARQLANEMEPELNKALVEDYYSGFDG